MTPTFFDTYGRREQASAKAPGRVNLIGEHTDYNDGFVLPTVVSLETRVEIARREDRVVEAISLHPQRVSARYTLGQEAPTGSWIDYVMGITRVLEERGGQRPGFSALIQSTIPWGAGLSSSAALLVATARALRAAFALQIDDVEIALIAHRAEKDFVGAPVGVMDPMVSSLGTFDAALFIDARTREFESVPLPPLDLVVIDSGVAHRHASGGYKERRTECVAACEALGIASLRDLNDVERASSLPPPLDRRARHVVSENARVLEAVKALRARDLPRLGQLFYESHASMRDDFEVSVPEVDALVEAARSQPGVHGARLTGGGFGGAVIILCRSGRGAQVARLVIEHVLANGLHGCKVLLTGREGR